MLIVQPRIFLLLGPEIQTKLYPSRRKLCLFVSLGTDTVVQSVSIGGGATCHLRVVGNVTATGLL
jgi:hypothetical protein